MPDGNQLRPQQLIQQLDLLRSEMLQLEASGMAGFASSPRAPRECLESDPLSGSAPP